MNEVANGWADFFVAEVGAAAALSGLVIVAISINLQRILTYPQLPGRAAESLFTLISALLVASVGLIPHQSAHTLGLEVTAIGLGLAASSATVQLRAIALVKGQPVKWWLPRFAISLSTATPMVIGGIQLMTGMPDGSYWIAAGILLSLVAGVYNTWVLLVEILR